MFLNVNPQTFFLKEENLFVLLEAVQRFNPNSQRFLAAVVPAY